jgi:hypothetical protein
MRTLKALAFAVAALALVGSQAAAQDARLMEFGIDGGISYDTESELTTIALPVGTFRVGFEMSPRFSLEPSFSILSTSGGDSERFTLYSVGLGLPIHFREMRSGPYVRPFIGVTGFSVSGESGSQFSAGAGVGTKIPVADNRFAWRLEAFFARGFESEPEFMASNQFGVSFGLSFFTR